MLSERCRTQKHEDARDLVEHTRFVTRCPEAVQKALGALGGAPGAEEWLKQSAASSKNDLEHSRAEGFEEGHKKAL